MFKTILIANRGEIACRIIRTARRMGLRAVAVYSEADRDAPHVAMADEAVPIGPPPAADSYLDIGKIVDAARQTKAEAVHPGYGFLAENAAFARALEEAGIAFIGPNIKAIEAMGDKIQSKKVAAKAGVSTVPGHAGVVRSAKEAARIAGGIGYPVMIKASAGGGGKGMRVVHSAREVEESFSSSRSEAKSSFGDDRLLIEKFVEEPRHIEIQVLGDRHGNIIHLGERECSIQRRNQKVIEEAPSPFIDADTREAMGAQAVALARAVDYENAGTVEFIVDKDRNFYFLEMNTRLQVEHPVTELVTGEDLVEHMIRIAAGEPLALKQEDVKLEGWAIEARVYAEDPERNFLPSIGRLVTYRPPEEGVHDGLTIRNDTGVAEGGQISIYYDPMIAKLITHGPGREAAVDHMADALDSFFIDGIRHNVAFLAAIMQNPRWRQGEISTGFLAQEYPEGFRPRAPEPHERDTLTVVAAVIDHLGNRRRRGISGQMEGATVRFARDRIVHFGDYAQRVTVSDDSGEEIAVALCDEEGNPGARFTVSSGWWFGDPVWTGRINGVETRIQVRAILNGHDLAYRGIHLPARVYTLREAELAARMPAKIAADTSQTLLCPMPGLVVAIHVSEGQDVKAGEPLCTVEAMKMENILRAERDARVARILVETGDSLGVDAAIMEFE